MPLSRARPSLVLTITLSLSASACNAPAPTVLQASDTPPPSPFPPTLAPSATPHPPSVLLVAPAESDATLVREISQALLELASAEGWALETRQDLPGGPLLPSTRLVVLLPPNSEAETVLLASPETHFLAVDLAALEPQPNLSTIGPQGISGEDLGFAAGFLAALVAPDWRVGAIRPPNDSRASAELRGFVNGFRYFCGFCRPAYPPFLQYPIVAELASGVSPAELQASFQRLKESGVQVAYLPSSIDAAMLDDSLTQGEIQLIGSRRPESLTCGWIASLRFDWVSALREVWPEIVGQSSDLTVPLGISVSDADESILTPGKRRLLNEVLAALSEGAIDSAGSGASTSP